MEPVKESKYLNVFEVSYIYTKIKSSHFKNKKKYFTWLYHVINVKCELPGKVVVDPKWSVQNNVSLKNILIFRLFLIFQDVLFHYRDICISLSVWIKNIFHCKQSKKNKKENSKKCKRNKPMCYFGHLDIMKLFTYNAYVHVIYLQLINTIKGTNSWTLSE